MSVTYVSEGDQATPTNMNSWLNEAGGEIYNVKSYGAVGDDATDDTAAIQAAIDAAEAAGGGRVQGTAGDTYRITSGLTIETEGVVFDLGGATLDADFASGWAVSVGNGTAVTAHIGVRNGTISTDNTDVTLNGVRFQKNVRRRVHHDKLRIKDFKGVGLKFSELNWSIQEGLAPLVENCGTNVVIDDNGNAITIVGLGVDNADGYNVQILGCVSITFVGGYNQAATTGGVLIDTGTVGSAQESVGVSFFGTYFENNGVSHIIGNDGSGLVMHGNYLNCNGMTGPAIDLNNWDGADIRGNAPRSLSTGSQRDFVNADANCTAISVGRQFVTTLNDVQVGGSVVGLSGADSPTVLSTLPTASLLNRGSIYLYNPGSGTGADRSRPYMVVDTASGTRAAVRIAMEQRKQTAVLATSPYTPSFTTVDLYDLTVPNTGLTINAPTGSYDDGEALTFLLKQDATGGGNITWNAAYATNLSNTGNTANTYASVSFRYSAGRTRWIQVGKLEWTA